MWSAHLRLSSKHNYLKNNIIKSVLANIDFIFEFSSVEQRYHFSEFSKFKFDEKSNISSKSKKEVSKRPLVIGGCNVDFIFEANESTIKLDGSIYPGSVRKYSGGVGRNIAEALTIFNCNPKLISVIGDDLFGSSLLQDNPQMDISGVKVLSDHSTASCCVLVDGLGEARGGIGDFDIHNKITPELVGDLKNHNIVVMDSNIPKETMEYIKKRLHNTQIPLIYEPTDIGLAHKPFFNQDFTTSITYATPNYHELCHMLTPYSPSKDVRKKNLKEILFDCIDYSYDLLLDVQCLLITLSENGVIIARRGRPNEPLPLKNDPIKKSPGEFVLSATHYPVPIPVSKIESVIGAGDCITSGFINGILQGCHQDICVTQGMQAAQLSLIQRRAVPQSFVEIQHNLRYPGYAII